MQSIPLNFIELFFQDPDLIWDLLVNNNGRPEDYKQFLVQCQKFTDGVLEAAVDDRRRDQTVEESTYSELYDYVRNCEFIYNNISYIFI